MAKQKSLEYLRNELSAKEAELEKAKQKLEQVEHKMNRLQNKIKTESKKQRDARTHALCFKAGHLEYVFPVIKDFMFQLNDNELEELRLQNVTANINSMSRTNPFVFTEQGIYMLATVLRGELAEQQSIFIMRAFREMKHYIKQNQQFVSQSEMYLVNTRVSEMSVQMANMVDRQKKTEQDMQNIQKSIDILNENFVSDKDFKNFVIYKGQKFEADAAYIDIYQQAKKSIYVVDDYVNTKTLQLLSQKQAGVEVVLFTENGHGKRGFLTTAVVSDFVQQYPTLRIKPNPDCHDRLIVLDYGLPTEQAFHCGASSKDAGKKLCAINVIADTSMIHPVIDKLLLAPDKQI